MRIRLLVLLVVAYLASAGLAKADAIYTLSYNPPDIAIHAPVWSFEVPAIITTDTTVTDFLSKNSGGLGMLGCEFISSVTISDPQTLGGVTSTLGGYPGQYQPCTNIYFLYEFGPITSFGTFIATFPGELPGDEAILTISPAATPEPSSLLLLGMGIIPMFWVARRKLGRPMEYRWAHWFSADAESQKKQQEGLCACA
jgi:hypothetical protein